MKAKIVISKERAENQALKRELPRGFQRKVCVMVCLFAILFKIVFDDFSFLAPQIKPHTSRMSIEVSGLSIDKGQANSMFQSQKFISASVFCTVHRIFHCCSFELKFLHF